MTRLDQIILPIADDVFSGGTAMRTCLAKLSEPMRPSWTLKLFLILTVFCATPAAWAGTCRIEAGRDWIAGRADAVPLGQVLAQLSEKTGYTIYVDEELVSEPVSFEISGKMGSEDALRRIIQPHSYATVYGKRSDSTGFDVLEVRIYTQGRRNGVHYVPLYPAAGSAGSTEAGYDSAKDGYAGAAANPPAPGFGNRSGAMALSSRSISNPAAVIQSRYGARRGAFGQGLLTTGNQGRGPDYRPSDAEMKAAYAAFRQDQNDYRKRAAVSQSRQSQSSNMQLQGSYRHQRNQALKKYITHN